MKSDPPPTTPASSGDERLTVRRGKGLNFVVNGPYVDNLEVAPAVDLRITLDRLQAAEARIAQYREALRRILDAFDWNDGPCPTCSHHGPEESHDPDCPFSLARSALTEGERA